MKQDYEKLNFTVGPVMSFDDIKQIGGRDVPYFRTAEFSAVGQQNEMLITKLLGMPQNSRAVFLTASGTAAMEASVMNCLSSSDKALVVDGGSFGHRFAELCRIHGVPFDRIALEGGHALTAEDLRQFDGKSYTAFIVNLHETSTGVLYDGALISDFCRRNGLFLIVDAISCFLADEFDSQKLGADVVVISSQKALALAPGLSIIALSGRAVERVQRSEVRSMYFDLKRYLEDGKRGQTPFTPAVNVLLQLNRRLTDIDSAGGAAVECARVAAVARDFRSKSEGLPFEMYAQTPSNAVSALRVCCRTRADEIFKVLKDEYDIFICPNGGALASEVFRVGHIGNITFEDNSCLIEAFHSMISRGRIVI